MIQPLFPDKSVCVSRVNRFARREDRLLKQIWNPIVQGHNAVALRKAETDVVYNLNRWQAYRNQHGQANVRFLSDLTRSKAVTNSLFKLVDATESGRLCSILYHDKELELVYDFLKEHMLQGAYARIVTVSKALLMIAGFSVGFDTKILDKLRVANPNLVAASGVWPFCLYRGHLQFIADQQSAWERRNGSMQALLPDVPIGQIMDRILWT